MNQCVPEKKGMTSSPSGIRLKLWQQGCRVPEGIAPPEDADVDEGFLSGNNLLHAGKHSRGGRRSFSESVSLFPVQEPENGYPGDLP